MNTPFKGGFLGRIYLPTFSPPIFSTPHYHIIISLFYNKGKHSLIVAKMISNCNDDDNDNDDTDDSGDESSLNIQLGAMTIGMTMTFYDCDGLTMVMTTAIVMAQIDDKGINNGDYNGLDKKMAMVTTQVGAMDELCLHFSTLHNQAEKRTCVLRSHCFHRCHY